MKKFDADAHTYTTISGRLPGATDVIKSEGLVAVEYMSEAARWKGKCVHRGAELLVKNELDWETVDEEIAGYLRSLENFLRTTGFVPAGVEEPCFDDAFACMPDLWGYLHKVPAIIEYKSGIVPAWTAIQTALQSRALRKEKMFFAQKRFGLRLMADGSLSKLEPFEDPSDDRVAMSMVDSFHWKREHRYLKDWNKKGETHGE